MIVNTIPERLQTVLAKAVYNNERDVKKYVRRSLDLIAEHYGVKMFHFMPPANAYGRVGIADILVVMNGRALAIETKFRYNKRTAPQMKFAEEWVNAGGLYYCVNERNIEEVVADIINNIK